MRLAIRHAEKKKIDWNHDLLRFARNRKAGNAGMSAMSFPPNQFAALNGALLTTAGKQSFRPKIVQILNDKAAGSFSIKVFQLLEAAHFEWVDPGMVILAGHPLCLSRRR